MARECSTVDVCREKADAGRGFYRLVELYEAELHEGVIHATHRTLKTEDIISGDAHRRENDVKLVWE